MLCSKIYSVIVTIVYYSQRIIIPYYYYVLMFICLYSNDLIGYNRYSNILYIQEIEDDRRENSENIIPTNISTFQMSVVLPQWN